MNSKVALLSGFCLILCVCGCVPSLHSLYIDSEDLVFDQELIGKWTSEKPEWQWTFVRADESEKKYLMTVVDEKDSSGQFEVHLVQIDEMRFLDIYPKEIDDWAVNDFYKLHVLGAHTFMSVDVSDKALVLGVMGSKDFKKPLKENPEMIDHEIVNDNVVLTAESKELQEFVKKYVKDSRVFGGSVELSKTETKSK